MGDPWYCGECQNRMFDDVESYLEHKKYHSLSCSTCRASFKSKKGMKFHLQSKSHKMASELEEMYLSTTRQEEVDTTSPDIDMDLPEDGNSTNIVYTMRSSDTTAKQGFFSGRKGLFRDRVRFFFISGMFSGIYFGYYFGYLFRI